MRLVARFPVHYDNVITCGIIEHDQRSLRNIDPDKLIASTNIILDELKRDSVFIEKFKDKVDYFFSNQVIFVAMVLSLTKKRKLDAIRFLIRSVRYDFSVVVRRQFLAAVKNLL